MSSFLGRCIGAAILIAVSTGASLASSDFVLAASKWRKTLITAEGGERWCGPTIRLKMILDADSPIQNNPEAWLDLANRLDAPIAAQCPKADVASLSVFEDGKAVGFYRSSANEAWRFSPAETPVDSVQVKTQKLAAFAVKDAPPLPLHINYESVMLALVGRYPLMLANSNDVLQCWAAYRWGGNVWMNVSKPNGEADIMQKALRDLLRESIKEKGGADPSQPAKITLLLKSELGPYDEDKKEFPVGYGHINVPLIPQCDVSMKTIPAAFHVLALDMGLVSGLPMDTEKAQSWKKASENGRGEISVDYVISLDLPEGKGASLFSNEEDKEEGRIAGTLDSAIIYGGGEAMVPLYVMTRQEVEQRRQAESLAYAGRIAQREKKERQMQIETLASSSFSVRLANWFSDEEINPALDLDNLRSLYRSIILEGKSVSAALLVKAGGDGREAIPALWPAGLVKMTLGSGVDTVSTLEKERWYLVRGEVDAVKNNSSPAMSLHISEIYACAKDECRELDDAEMIVDKKRHGDTND